LDDHRAHLRRQPPADDHHAVLVLIHVERAAPVTPSGFPRFCDPVYSPPAADDALDVLCGAGPPDLEQSLLGLRSGHARERADLRVRELAPRERLRQAREGPPRTRDPNALADGHPGYDDA